MSNQLTTAGWSKKTLWLLLFQAFGLSLLAQVQISGRVTGPQNEGLAGITVQVQSTRYSTSTDAEGNYSLSAPLKPGSYQVLFTGIGFKAQSLPVQVSGNGTETINAQLQEDALKLDEVVVTGTSAGTTRR